MLVRVHDADEKYRTRPLARKKTESQRRVRGSISRIRWLTEAAEGNRRCVVEPSEIAKAESTVDFIIKTENENARGIFHVKRNRGTADVARFRLQLLTSPLPAARTVSASRSSVSLLAASVASADAAS